MWGAVLGYYLELLQNLSYPHALSVSLNERNYDYSFLILIHVLLNAKIKCELGDRTFICALIGCL